MTRGDYYELYDSNPSQNGRISFTCTYRLYRITHWCDQKRGHAIYFRFPFEDCVAGIDNFTDMIGDETVATDPEALVEFLTEKGHPALSMDPMM